MNTQTQNPMEMTIAERRDTFNLEVLNDKGQLFWTVPLKLIDGYSSNNDETIYTIHFRDFDNVVKVRKDRIKNLNIFQMTIVGIL